MGHLINPTAMRIGWLYNWCDSWFSEFTYYSEFFHEIYRIRLYLYYFFASRDVEKVSLILNKFEVFIKSNFFIKSILVKRKYNCVTYV